MKTGQKYAAKAFNISSHYDTVIFNYLNNDINAVDAYKADYEQAKKLRYGENPHQRASFYGEFDDVFEQLHGKELSYNNLLDVDAAVNLMSEFKDDKPTFAVLKHNNACGLAQRDTVLEAYEDALAGDPVSAFGGILISNTEIDKTAAEKIHQLFCEVVIAPSFAEDALETLKGKKNRILLVQKKFEFKEAQS